MWRAWPLTEQRAASAQAHVVLEFLGMEDTAHLPPAELPYGKQKQVEFARALMQKARLIMLDEPMAGMSKPEKMAMSSLIQRVRHERGATILVVEHDVPVVMEISDQIVVLDFGRKIADGTPASVQPKSGSYEPTGSWFWVCQGGSVWVILATT